MHRKAGMQTQAGPGNAPGSYPGALESARPPEPPPLSRAALRATAERVADQRAREDQERRSMLRGLILLGVLVVLFTLFRYGLGQALPHGWWQRW